MRPINMIRLPMSNGTLRAQTLRAHSSNISGRGVGAVLLDGGIGGQSSYQNVNAYENATGKNPYIASTSGRGLSQINSKLESLMITPKKKGIKKNINFNM